MCLNYRFVTLIFTLMNLKHCLKLVFSILPYVALVLIIKLIAHRYSLEVIPLNALFASLIGLISF